MPGLNELNRTPVKAGGPPSSGSDWFVTPTSKPLDRTPNKASSKKVFGSLERGLDKMKNMLTPRYRA